MESAENKEQPIFDQEPEENSDASLSKIETIALLNDSIDRLEQTIKGISKSSAPIPSSDSINTLLATTQELADAVTPTLENTSTPGLEETSPTAAKTKSEPEIPEKTASLKVSQNNSDQQPKELKGTKVKKKQNVTWIIIGITAIAIILAAILWFWLPRQPAIISSSELTPDFATNLENSESVREQQNNLITPSMDAPALSESLPLKDLSSAEESINLVPEDPTEILIPDNLESPGRAKNLKLVKIEPELELTPEQNLVAAINNKITKLVQDYPTELINSAQVNLLQNSLLVNVTDEWYELSESRQNKIANQMLNRSRKFSFQQLELKDNAGTLVARNPVIGEEIIILQNNRE